MKRKIFFTILIVLITLTNIILFKNFYNNKIKEYNIEIKNENINEV